MAKANTQKADGEFLAAVSFATFACDVKGNDLIQANAPRKRIQNIGMTWQTMGMQGTFSEAFSLGGDHNRANEINGLMGSAGEQLVLAWAAEQDSQRWYQTARGRDASYHRMAVRALCEMSSYFSLGVAHALANTVLRVLYLDPNMTATIRVETRNKKRPNAFMPGSVDKSDWPSFNEHLVDGFRSAIRGANAPQACNLLVDVLDDLRNDGRFINLEARRGMDYHRHRPQSLPNSSPRTGAWNGGSLAIGGLHDDADADEHEIRKIAVQGLEAVATAMSRARPAIGKAAKSLNYTIVGC